MNIWKNIALEPANGNTESLFLCPHCGSNYTHQEEVRTYFRDKEDSPTGIAAVVDSSACRVLGSQSGNPSGRRDGLVIVITCEQCPALTHLQIYQHKGQTFINTQHDCNGNPQKEEECE